GTIGVNMELLYQPFLAMLPEAGTILDAGCGSGRDSKAFLDRGYSVTAIDASAKMTEATTCLTGLAAVKLQFQQMEFANDFDGIWACASLLHVPRSETDTVLSAFAHALRPNGVCYLSFKEGNGERLQDGRHFTDFTTSGLKAALAHHCGFEIIDIWTTADARPDRGDQWVNALVGKRESRDDATDSASEKF
ncbi:MAG: SAM-dependent methyltransferase, partial [Planctomycetaceae bacterium]